LQNLQQRYARARIPTLPVENPVTAIVLQGDARHLPLPDACVDLVVTSPPYFGLRSYTDGGEHYPGQLGSEATPAEYVAALVECTREWMRVLKPSGSMFINLGDRYATTIHAGNPLRMPNKATDPAHRGQLQRVARDSTAPDAPPKSLLGLPWRYALAVMDQGAPHLREQHFAALTDDVLNGTITEDVFWRSVCEYDAEPKPRGLGLILRAEIVWAKPNGLPESVTDRVRRAHEQVFHLVKQPRYYSAIDEIREPHALKTLTHRGGGESWGNERNPDNNWGNAKVRVPDPLGKLPGSVWSIPSAPLAVPQCRLVLGGRTVKWFMTWEQGQAHMRSLARYGWDGPGRPSLRPEIDHFAAFPPALVRPLVLGWSPPGVCTACMQSRRPVSDSERTFDGEPIGSGDGGIWQAQNGRAKRHTRNQGVGNWRFGSRTTITGYACACPSPDAPTRPAVVLDPFAGTGTTLLVASAYGRTGVGTDLSRDYCRLARWRTRDPGERARARDMPKPPPVPAGMEPLFDMEAL